MQNKPKEIKIIAQLDPLGVILNYSNKIDKAYNNQPNLISTVDYYLEKFKSLLGVKVHLKDICKLS